MDRIMVDQVQREEQASLELFTRINLEDLYRAFAVPTALHPVAALLLTPFARRFAEDLRRCDERIGEIGLQKAMGETLGRFGVTLEIVGLGTVPRRGPLIVAANHPGLTDVPALLASLPRPDIRVLSAQRSLLEALPNLHARLLIVDKSSPQRTIYGVLRHLRAGGALLTFPAGQIEPDPTLDAAGAAASLASWSESIELLCRLEPRTRVVPAIVSGVTTPETLRHPFTALQRDPKEKAWLAACLQVMSQRYQRNRVTVRFGSPLSAWETGGQVSFDNVLRQSRTLLAASQPQR